MDGDATHYFSGGILCGASSSRLAMHREGVTCAECLELLGARSDDGPEAARVLDRYAALVGEDEVTGTGESTALSPRRRAREAPLDVRGWMSRLLELAWR